MAHFTMQHALYVGPIKGVITLDDGTVLDVAPAGHTDVVEVGHLSDEQVEEASHRVSMHYFENGHPDDIETEYDAEGNEVGLVQRPFLYVPPKRFAHELHGKKPKGTPHKSGPHAEAFKTYVDTHTKAPKPGKKD